MSDLEHLVPLVRVLKPAMGGSREQYASLYVRPSAVEVLAGTGEGEGDHALTTIQANGHKYVVLGDPEGLRERLGLEPTA